MITNLTPAKCIEACRENGYSFAGVQYAEECFCGNEAPPPIKIVAMSECNMGCTGDSSIKCGGSYRNNVYKIEGILSFKVISRQVKLLSKSDSDTRHQRLKFHAERGILGQSCMEEKNKEFLIILGFLRLGLRLTTDNNHYL